MPTSSDWLSLKVLKREELKRRLKKRQALIFSIPKRTVPLAVRRNRLKRLLREAVRKQVFFQDESKAYCFKVKAWPGDIGLREVEKAVHQLL